MSISFARKARLTRGKTSFEIAWAFCVLFYFVQYSLRSAPGVMVPELTAAHSLNALGISALLGLYYYTYSVFALVSGASLDRLGAKYVIPVGILMVAVGAVLFGIGDIRVAEIGRLLQGAGSAFAFTGAVYLAARGFSPAYLATAVGFTQCFGMMGGSAGQFAVAPLIHSLVTWQQFWLLAGLALLVVAILVLIVTPSGHDAPHGTDRSIWSIVAPYKIVLANPQSYLCGIVAGLLFLPTTIADMIWGVPFVRDGLGLSYASAVNHAAIVPFGWVIGCPLLGYLADRMGRRKPILLAGTVVMFVAGLAILYLPPASGLLYFYGLVFGIGSGAAMIPYSVIKEVNPDWVKGSATGAINFLVFAFSALAAPLYGWLLMHLAGGHAVTLSVFRSASVVWLVVIAVAAVVASFLRETGSAVTARQ